MSTSLRRIVEKFLRSADNRKIHGRYVVRRPKFEDAMGVKQVIVVRKDLSMRRGKEIAQGSHAAMAFLSRQLQGGKNEIKLSEAAREWIESSFAKVCVRVNSEQELLEIKQKAEQAGLEVHLVMDSGKTEFDGVPTMTCLAIGPDQSEKIDAVTGHLKLY